jgi:hypothetical protein
MKLPRKPPPFKNNFQSPDVIHRAADATVIEDPDEPTRLVIVQIKDAEGKIIHVRMEKGMCMTMLTRGTRCLRVDIGLSRAGDVTRWQGAWE